MSVLESISIQGIRSFDPKNSEVLHFLKPVTLILGQNGTGKTTIIESLKYASTGELPAGSKVGGCFVHDPKIAGETEVKAKVSLSIKNLKGENMTVTRALKVTQSNRSKQASMQTLDSSIQKTQSNGERSSISSKCADINIEMTNSLGVSKAVLENVIFCHQEDSNWPLTEPKQVKERFDDLFASTRYVKALESIRKIKMNKESEMKIIKSELKYLQNDLKEFQLKTTEQNILEDQINNLKSKKESVQNKLDPIDVSIEKYRNQYTRLYETNSQKDVFENEKLSINKQIVELERNITEPINYSVIDLEKIINDSDLILLNLEQSVAKEDSIIKDLEHEINNSRKEINKFLQEKGAVESKISHYANKEKEFNDNIERLVKEVNISYDKEGPSLMIRNFKNHIDHLLLKFNDKKKELADKLNIIEHEMESTNSSKISLENEIEMNKRTQRQKQNELYKLEKKLEAIGHDSTKLNSNNTKLNDFKLNLAEIQSKFDSKQIRESLNQLSCCIIDLENQLHDTDALVHKYQIAEMKYNEINSQKQQKSEKTSSYKRLRNRHNDSLRKLFDNIIPETNLKKMLNQKLSQFKHQHNETQKSHLSLQTSLSASEFELKQMKDNIVKHQQVIDKFDEDVYKICGNYDLENSLKEKRERKMKLEEKLLTLQSSVSLYSKFQDMLQKNKSDCPLCHREFHHNSEVDDLIEEINEKCDKAPSEINRITNEISQLDEIITSLFKLDTQLDKITDLREHTIKNLNDKCQIKKNEIIDLQNSISQIAVNEEINSSNERIASSIIGDVANMEKYIEEINAIDINIQTLENQLTLSAEEFNNEYENAKIKKKSIQEDLQENKNELEKQRKIYEDSTNNENMLNNQINELMRENLNIQKGLQEWSSYQIQKETFMTEITGIEDQLQSCYDKLSPVIDSLKEIKNQRDLILNDKKNYEISENFKISSLHNELEIINRNWSEMINSKSENLNEQLENIESKIQNLNSKIKEYSSDINNSKSRIALINSQISNHKIKLREYTDTLQIRHHQEKLIKMDESIGLLNAQLAGIDLGNMNSKMKELEKERRQIKDEIDSLESRKIQIDTKIECVGKELATTRLMKAESNYLAMVYKIKVTELAISDLDKYYKAFDKAIMSYHQAKMTEVNKILKELWRNTYSGNDIDYIEICSDEDSSSAASKRRTYNYRVVMVKSNGGARLDMRGRCSAGQKVLACLLIRLSLAEVFCLHCGVLALDEPTTNLDQENIERLAYALVEIIKSRSIQKNFQLIVITHDEEFVDLLGRSDFVEDYYRIYADINGHSKINICGISSSN